MPIKLINGFIPLKERYRMYVINQHNFESVPRNGLFGEWLFAGSPNDTSGSGYNGTASGATLTTDRKGISNSAYEWDGTADWVYVDFVTDVRALFGVAFTVSFWVKFDVTTTDRTLIHVRDGGGPYTGLLIQKQNDGELRIYIANSVSNYNNADINVGINTTDWFHFVLTAYHSGSNLYVELFKNGSSVFTASPAYNLSVGYIMHSLLDRIVFGALDVASSRIHDGKLDDIRMYNRVLTADEITALYNE